MVKCVFCIVLSKFRYICARALKRKKLFLKQAVKENKKRKTKMAELSGSEWVLV